MRTDSDPGAASGLDNPDLLVACGDSTVLREHAAYVRAQADRAPGHLRRCIDQAQELMHSRSAVTMAGAVNMLGGSALLARDEEALVSAAQTAERRLGPGSPTTEIARHRLGLLRGEPSRVEPHLRDGVDNFSPSGLHLLVREAMDAGGADIAVEAARSQMWRGPYSQAVLACCEGAESSDEARWHDALQLAARHSLRLLVVDALEGLVATASSSGSWMEALRLYGAALRLRDECEYQWRFPSEESALEDAVVAARQGLEPADAQQAQADGRALDWPEAARYASRARGERKRPRHGWAALTPTEEQVVALVAEGLTNPEIATRLLMGRATVKTHLEHVFAKLGVRSRVELASRAAQRPRPTR